MSINIAIFASGSGTNAENIVRYFSNNDDIRVRVVMTNVRSAYVLQRAKDAGIPSVYFSKGFWTDGKAILSFLKQQEVDIIVLAGFLARIPDALTNAYPDRIVNIHPSLLPKHGGKGMYGIHVHEAVINDGDKESGITIHYINEHLDQGQIIEQHRCGVRSDDTPETLADRVHALEYKFFPEAIERLALRLLEEKQGTDGMV